MTTNGSFIVKVATVTDSQKDEYEKRRLAFIVTDPWNDPFCAKNGLTNMYIENTIAEILYLRAESEPGVKLNCPNPVYGTYHKLLGACLKVRGKKEDEITKAFLDLVKFLKEVLDVNVIEITKWDPTSNYIPDIRLIDTIGEALGWLSNYIGMDLRT
jgi:hypothetical protein